MRNIKTIFCYMRSRRYRTSSIIKAICEELLSISSKAIKKYFPLVVIGIFEAFFLFMAMFGFVFFTALFH